MQTVKLTNGSPRPIEALYVYPLGAPDHGASRGTLAPSASMSVQMKTGNIEVQAISALIVIDPHTRDKRTSSTAVELTGPKEVVFFDAEQKPVLPASAIGVPFQSTKVAPPEAPAPPADPGP